MISGTQGRVAVAIAALVMLSGCGDAEPTAEESRDSGRDYGQTLVDTVGTRASPEDLRALCGNAIVDGKMVDQQTGEPGEKADVIVEEFVAGCTEAVEGQ